MDDSRFESSLFVYQWMIFNLVDISKHLKYCIKRENTMQLLCILVFESHYIKSTPFGFLAGQCLYFSHVFETTVGISQIV